MSAQQTCALNISGYVKDTDTGEPLVFAGVYEDESGQEALTDSSGFFQLKNLCKGTPHIIISHIGCQPQRIFVPLYKDTLLAIFMEHSTTELNSVTVRSHELHLHTQASDVVNKQDIIDKGASNFSTILDNIAGVSTIKNGNGIAKPVVHGLYGNRLAILNNGVPQNGQQWGNDHAPEIDPLVANSITVIKGASTLEYMGKNLGSIILVKPSDIAKEPHWHGRASYFFETNGLFNGANVEVQKYTPVLAWKINGTLKKGGDKSAASYFLNNTGLQEANLALQLEKSLQDKWLFQLYASTFNTEIGVLRGSHIGNLTDLKEALKRKVPFFTESDFSYAIQAPKQIVNHHLVKLHVKYTIDLSQRIDITLAGQLNLRKEFDIRRGNRSDIPSFSLEQFSLFSEAKYTKGLAANWTLKSGFQYRLTDNTNNPQTGILPFIPDYLSATFGIFITMHKKLEKSFLDFGLRYDNQEQKVAHISNTIPREIIRYQRMFHNISGSVGYAYFISKQHKVTANLGYAMRNPAINELYSRGLHQGVSGIEEGDINLQTESAIKATLAYTLNVKSKVSLQTLIYYQTIKDYIYLSPQNKIRLTIRGAFPTFKYEQTQATIVGIDISIRMAITQSFYASVKYSFIRGTDTKNSIPLINMPSNNILARLVYQAKKAIRLWKKKLENFEVELSSRYVFKQDNILEYQDFVLPPHSYHLLGMKISSNLQLKKTRLRIVIKIDNILNTTYRDYLNRQRYFSDDMGINASLGISVKF